MAFLWLEADGGWAAARLEPGTYAFAVGGSPAVRKVAPGGPPTGVGRLLGQRMPTGHDRWVLLAAGREVRVNGDPVWLGLRLLKDRDEIRLPSGERFYFSAEQLAEIVPLPAFTHPVLCPRCHKPIQAGDAAVLCPGCQTWHHQTEARPCWRYDDRCALCPQPTALNARLSWTPENL